MSIAQEFNKAVQEILHEAGLLVKAVDGVWDHITQDAWRAFATKHGHDPVLAATWQPSKIEELPQHIQQQVTDKLQAAGVLSDQAPVKAEETTPAVTGTPAETDAAPSSTEPQPAETQPEHVEPEQSAEASTQEAAAPVETPAPAQEQAPAEAVQPAEETQAEHVESQPTTGEQGTPAA